MLKLDIREREAALDELLGTLKVALSEAHFCDSDDAGEIITLLDTAIHDCKDRLEYVSELVADEDRWEQQQADAAWRRDCTMAG